MADSRNLPPEVVAALKAGNRIEAMRLLRERMGVGLAEARMHVQAHESPAASPADVGNDRMRARAPARAAPARMKPPGYVKRDGLSPGEVPRTGGGAQAMIVVIAILIALWAYAKIG